MKICKEIYSYQEYLEYVGQQGGGCTLAEEAGDFNPCYLSSLVDTQDLPREIAVGDFLELVAEDVGPAIIQYSVTSEEERYEEWVQAAYDVPGATVTSLDRGGYFVYLCAVPIVPQFDEE